MRASPAAMLYSCAALTFRACAMTSLLSLLLRMMSATVTATESKYYASSSVVAAACATATSRVAGS
jgi:hypothetical protein